MILLLKQYLLRSSISFLFILITFYGCSSSKSTIKVFSNQSNKQTIVKMNRNLKKITGIKFPLSLTIENNTFFNKSFIRIDYYYGSDLKGVGVELFSGEKRISNNKKKKLQKNEKLEYSIYSRHYTDSTSFTQKQLQSYVKKMLVENKDTLHVGTVTEFRKKHAALFEKLTKGDSISIQFIDNGKFGECVTVPVEW